MDINAKKASLTEASQKANLDTSMMEQRDMKQCYSKTKELKSKIPKLNLQMLPNYHGKSNKSLNQYLLAAYQQNHKCEKKQIFAN